MKKKLKLSDKELLLKLESTVIQEQKLTIVVLELLQEVENRKLYCDLGYHSLFAYVTRHLGYSEAEASVRVNATRLIKSVPSVKKEIDEGNINLTQASKIQSLFCRENFDEKKKKEVVKRVARKTTRDTEKILGELATSKKKEREKKITLRERLLKKIEQIQYDYDGLSELEVIESLVDEYLEKKKQARPTRKSSKKSIRQRYIPRQVKDLVDERAGGRCEYVSPTTGQRCRCRTNLQYDHIQPVAMGGKSTVNNLRRLCFNHNARAAIKDLGLEFMEQKRSSRDRPRANSP